METAAVEHVWYSVPEAEQYTGLSYVTLWRGVRAGDLRASGRGRGVKFRRDDLDRWMESRGQKQRPAKATARRTPKKEGK